MAETLYIEAINRALHEEMERDDDVVVIGLDVARQGGLFGATKKLYERFGAQRVMDTPISEAGFTGAAIGMAMEGLRPVVEMQFADFVTVAFDQLSTVAAKMHFMTQGAVHVPLVVRMPYGVNVTGEGYMTGAGPHHSQSPESWFCHIAGLKVVMPSSPADALGLLKSAIRDENPVIATGAMVMLATAVADKLDSEGVSVEVVDPRTLVPLDRETLLTSVAKTGRVVITHEAPQTAGFGGEIAAMIAEQGFSSLKAPIRRVCALDMPVPPGSMARASMPTQERIEAAIRELL